MRASRLLIAAGALIAGLAANAAPIAKKSFFQESRTTTVKDKQTQVVTRKIWIEYPGKVHMEEALGAQSRLTVCNGSDLWIALPTQKKGQHRKLTPQEAKVFADRIHVDLDMVPKFLQSGAKKVRQEKVNGLLCDVYQREKNGQLTLALWVAAKGPRLPQKQEESGIIRAADRAGEPMKTHILRQTTEYLKWQIDQPIDQSLFRAPGGVTYEEFKRPAASTPSKR